MGFHIQSGDHNPYQAKVNADGQLLVNSTSNPALVYHAAKGNAYYIINDVVSVTNTASYNGMLYIKNTSDVPLHIAQIRTCNTVPAVWMLYKNPSTGTLISAGSEKIPENLYFGSGAIFNGVVLHGANAATVTNGSMLSHWINGVGHSIQDIGGAIILNKNSSLAFSVKPTATADCCVTVLAYYKDISVT